MIEKGQEIQNSVDSYDHFIMATVKKTDKLVIALYMVTDCMEEGEPLKLKLRSLGVDFVSLIKLVEHSDSFEKNLLLSDTIALITEIVSFVEIGGSVGLITSMNASILLKEFHALREECMKHQPETFFTKKDNRTLSSFMLTEEMLRSDIKDTDYYKGHENNMSFIQPQSSHTNQGFHEKNDQKNLKETQSKKLDMALKITRRNSILKLIKDKKEVTIKDITTVISDCSEKTVQRELLSLVSLGVLKKIGDKRWSKYSLV